MRTCLAAQPCGVIWHLTTASWTLTHAPARLRRGWDDGQQARGKLGRCNRPACLQLLAPGVAGAAQCAMHPPVLHRTQCLTPPYCFPGPCRRLKLGSPRQGSTPAVPTVLGSLGGSPLHELRLAVGVDAYSGVAAALQPLQRLRALTRLQLANGMLRSAPAQLSALDRLAVLDLSSNKMAGAGGLQPLQSLTALRSLAVLNLAGNTELGVGGPGVLLPLRALTGLLALDVSSCGGCRMLGLRP